MQAFHDIIVLHFHEILLGKNNKLQSSMYVCYKCISVIRNIYVLEIHVRNIKDMISIYIYVCIYILYTEKSRSIHIKHTYLNIRKNISNIRKNF